MDQCASGLGRVRFFVKEPEVWRTGSCSAPNGAKSRRLFSIFKRGVILNTLNACWFMASGFVLYYTANVLFPTHLQVDPKLSSGEVGVAANRQFFFRGDWDTWPTGTAARWSRSRRR